MPRYEDIALALVSARERAAALCAVLEGPTAAVLTQHEREDIETTLRELTEEVIRLEAELRLLRRSN